MTNRRIADVLEQVAGLLEEQGADVHRVRSWRMGAQGVREHPEEMGDVFRDRGRDGLEAVPHIGRHLSAVIIELLRTGRSAALDRLRGESTPADRFARLPGVGRELGERIHHELGIETLEELELAAHDGSLRTVPGFGPRRVAAVRDILAGRLAHRQAQGAADEPSEPPPVGVLLEIDRAYRTRAAAGELKKVAPRRFNPGGEAWLPMMHETQGGWSFTALHSNTALAHRLRKTRDWVVVYYHQPGRDEGRATIVTETVGALRGRRVVRGRERECASHYRVGAAA
jgi:DNA polymerase (family 10)